MKTYGQNPRIAKSAIIHYHNLRNKLYHEGKNFVPVERDIQGAREAALYIFATLFNTNGFLISVNSASQNAQIPTPASNRPKSPKKPLEKYPIAQISRHSNTTIREVAKRGCFVIAGAEAVSSASRSKFLMRCLLRFPSFIVSASNAPVSIQRLTIYALTRHRAATSCGVKNSSADHVVVNGSASIHISKKNQSSGSYAPSLT